MARGANSRGGYRQPSTPAAVSPPGSGRRTDGGPAKPFPIPAGQGYGERAQLEATQQGVAPPETGGSVPGGGAPDGPPVLAERGPIDPFGPTNHPLEPPTTGVHLPGSAPIDSDALLRAMYARRPSPWLARLLRD